MTTAGLGALTWALLVLHALSYGMTAVIAPESGASAPDSGRHVLAFAVGVGVQLACTVVLAWLGPRTAIRTWTPAAQALGTALTAAAAGTCALLLTLGISPLDFLLAL